MPQGGRPHARFTYRARLPIIAFDYGSDASIAGVVDEASGGQSTHSTSRYSTQEFYWTTPRDHRTHPPAALSPSRRLRGSVYHHVLSASGANTALLRGQKPTRARGRHGQKEAWGVGYTPSAGGG